MKKAEEAKYRRLEKLLTIIQSGFIFLLIVLVVFMMVQIHKLQGTARVVNYAGLVRGATQRLVKLEMTENPSDNLVVYLDDILSGLKYEKGSCGLVSLPDKNYQMKLDELMLYWESVKEQIELIRKKHYESADMAELLQMSEVYFHLADETVSAAEIYSDKIARKIQVIELISAVDMILMFGIIVLQMVSAMRMRKKNLILARKAYIDLQTGLQNKNMCAELLANKKILEESTACLVFDINNLKHTNDTLGHLVGDQLIENFAKALKSVAHETDFVGRYGGDEFVLVLYESGAEEAQAMLARLQEEIERLNCLETIVSVSYAHGWAVSTDFENCTFKMLFDAADHSMYLNKKKSKIQSIAQRKENNL